MEQIAGSRVNVLRCIKIGNARIRTGMHVLRYAIAFGNV